MTASTQDVPWSHTRACTHDTRHRQANIYNTCMHIHAYMFTVQHTRHVRAHAHTDTHTKHAHTQYVYIQLTVNTNTSKRDTVYA